MTAFRPWCPDLGVANNIHKLIVSESGRRKARESIRDGVWQPRSGQKLGNEFWCDKLNDSEHDISGA